MRVRVRLLMFSLLLAAVFLIVAIIFAMLGQGGGALYTPIQVLTGIPFHEAATTSLFLIMVVSVSSTLVYRKSKRVDAPLVVALESITAAGAFLGGLSSIRFSGAQLSIGFAIFITFAAIFMILPINTDRAGKKLKTGFPYWQRQLGEEHYAVNLAVALPASFAAGLASGLLGIGGGLIKVPLMVLLLNIPMDIAIGSSALMVGITATTGFAGHVTNGHWNPKLALSLAVAVFIGAQIGARFSLKVNKKTLKKSFGYFLVAIAAIMVLKAVGVFPGKPKESPSSQQALAALSLQMTGGRWSETSDTAGVFRGIGHRRRVEEPIPKDRAFFPSSESGYAQKMH
jgi:uncharacterized protein